MRNGRAPTALHLNAAVGCRAQVPTVALLNAALLGCIGCLVFLLAGAVTSGSWLVPHAAFLLLLAVGLLISINWCAVEQRRSCPNRSS